MHIPEFLATRGLLEICNSSAAPGDRSCMSRATNCTRLENTGFRDKNEHPGLMDSPHACSVYPPRRPPPPGGVEQLRGSFQKQPQGSHGARSSTPSPGVHLGGCTQIVRRASASRPQPRPSHVGVPKHKFPHSTARRWCRGVHGSSVDPLFPSPTRPHPLSPTSSPREEGPYMYFLSTSGRGHVNWPNLERISPAFGEVCQFRVELGQRWANSAARVCAPAFATSPLGVAPSFEHLECVVQ